MGRAVLERRRAFTTRLSLQLTRRQQAFLTARADEVLFGGAAGGGKSYAQLIDALVYALRYPGSRQLLLRRSYPDLERSLIQEHLRFYPRGAYRYGAAVHRGLFGNGSVLEFGFCDSERDVYRYQGAQYDVIRFDELTHFTETQYLYLLSRLRGANRYPKQVKSTANPGGVGHAWVKERFIAPSPPGTLFSAAHGTRLFLPSRVQDNPFLMKKDPGYLKRLENLPEAERRALLLGEWDLAEGSFFSEFRPEAHTAAPFAIPARWRRWFTLDYGMDMLAGLWIAMDEEGTAWVYREVYEPGLILSEAARAILAAMPPGEQESLEALLAPPDLWSARQETGRSAADIFAENGLRLTKTGNRRVDGWRAVREFLRLRPGPDGRERAGLRIFTTCRNLIRTLPALTHSSLNPEDAALEPHELTHAPDALRGFCTWWAGATPPLPAKRAVWAPDQWQDYRRASGPERDYLIARWGNPF